MSKRRHVVSAFDSHLCQVAENTRGALFDAMERKKTYATTGSRMEVRFFDGWDFTNSDVYENNAVDIGYQKGVSMGGDLTAQDNANDAPSFMVSALRDPLSGNLDRVQIIEG